MSSFEELGLSPEILSAIKASGYTTPTPIQSKAIPVVLNGGDVTGIAQTGTGKTAAFVLPMLHKLAQGRARARMPRTLILEPTRELAAQVAENFKKYGVNQRLTMALLIGGVSFGDQDRLLSQGVDVLIATPGRMLDHFERGKLLLTGVEMFVIDEADRMLDMGFIPDIERICKLIPPRRQTLLFSATMPPEIARLAEQFQKFPERIEASRPAQTAETITQYKVPVSSNDAAVKRAALRAVIRSCDVTNGIVFCNRKREVDVVAKSLSSHGFDAAAIHGDLPQAYRTQTLDRFRAGDLKLLIASDVAARGLDIPAVGHVFNYTPPPHADDYIHRIGRTGRAGRTGESFTLVSPEDSKLWDAVVKKIGQTPVDYAPEGLAEVIEEAASRAPRGRSGGASQDRSGGRSSGRTSGSSSGRSSGRSPGSTSGASGGRSSSRTSELGAPDGVELQEAGGEGSRGPAASRSRSRSRSRTRDEADRATEEQVSAQADAPASAPAPAAERVQNDRPERGPRRRGPRSGDAKPQDAKPQDAKPQDIKSREAKPRQDRDLPPARGGKVLGMGDHVPAFLRGE